MVSGLSFCWRKDARSGDLGGSKAGRARCAIAIFSAAES